MTVEQQLQNERERYAKLFMDYAKLEHIHKWYVFELGRTVQHTGELAKALRSRVDEMGDPEKKYEYDTETLDNLAYMSALADGIIENLDKVNREVSKAAAQSKQE